MPQLVSGMKNNWPKPQWRITSAIFSGAKKTSGLKIQSKQTIFKQKLQKTLKLENIETQLNTFGLIMTHWNLTRPSGLLFGLFRHFLEVFGYIWISLNSTFEWNWKHLNVIENIWQYLDTFDNIWIHLTIFGYNWRYLDTFDNIWIHKSTYISEV